MISSKYEENYNLKNTHFMYSGESTCSCFFSFCVVIISVCWDSSEKRLKKSQYLHKYSENFKRKAP